MSLYAIRGNGGVGSWVQVGKTPHGGLTIEFVIRDDNTGFDDVTFSSFSQVYGYFIILNDHIDNNNAWNLRILQITDGRTSIADMDILTKSQMHSQLKADFECRGVIDALSRM